MVTCSSGKGNMAAFASGTSSSRETAGTYFYSRRYTAGSPRDAAPSTMCDTDCWGDYLAGFFVNCAQGASVSVLQKRSAFVCVCVSLSHPNHSDPVPSDLNTMHVEQELTSVLQGLFSIARKSEAQRKPFGPLEELYVQGKLMKPSSISSTNRHVQSSSSREWLTRSVSGAHNVQQPQQQQHRIRNNGCIYTRLQYCTTS